MLTKLINTLHWLRFQKLLGSKETNKRETSSSSCGAEDLSLEFLQPHKDFVIIEEFNNGVDAVKAINNFKPDLVFLDIQMPGFTGFEVIQRLIEMPQIIFSTAYDQYAFKAFEVHAVDYLLKPFKQERFDEAEVFFAQYVEVMTPAKQPFKPYYVAGRRYAAARGAGDGAGPAVPEAIEAIDVALAYFEERGLTLTRHYRRLERWRKALAG